MILTCNQNRKLHTIHYVIVIEIKSCQHVIYTSIQKTCRYAMQGRIQGEGSWGSNFVKRGKKVAGVRAKRCVLVLKDR